MPTSVLPNWFAAIILIGSLKQALMNLTKPWNECRGTDCFRPWHEENVRLPAPTVTEENDLLPAPTVTQENDQIPDPTVT
jgi:hypothetical protein